MQLSLDFRCKHRSLKYDFTTYSNRDPSLFQYGSTIRSRERYAEDLRECCIGVYASPETSDTQLANTQSIKTSILSPNMVFTLCSKSTGITSAKGLSSTTTPPVERSDPSICPLSVLLKAELSFHESDRVN
jgi:hypothetical protein